MLVAFLLLIARQSYPSRLRKRDDQAQHHQEKEIADPAFYDARFGGRYPIVYT